MNGKVSIKFDDIKDNYLFMIQITNNELTKTLNKITAILNKKPVTSSYPSISDLYQDLIDTIVEGGIYISSPHLEVILMNQIRDANDMYGKPKWWEHNPAYSIITLNEALTNNPSITISLSYQKIKRMFYNPLTFKKNGASFMDLFFMENPQKIIYDLPEEENYDDEIKPGDIINPVIMLDDVNKITVINREEMSELDEE